MRVGNNGIGGWLVDTANTCIILAVVGDANVPIVSPRWTPRVSDNPVILAAFRTKANKGNTVIKSGTTRIIIQDSTSVCLKYILICLNCNRHRPLSDSCSKLFWIIRSDIDERSNRNLALGSIKLTFTILSLVRVSKLRLYCLSFSIRKCLVHPAPVASHIPLSSWTIDKLLLRKWK